MRKCLRLTSGVSRKGGSAQLVRGVGVAAHVFSAAEQGPRGRGSLTPEEVGSFANGLWTCATHSREVDDFQERFPAEDLLRMKAVRELAHELERSDDHVAFFVKQGGVEPWNEWVWRHVAATPVEQIPDFDAHDMIQSFKSEWIQRQAVLDGFEMTIRPRLPAYIAVKPVAAAAAALVRPARHASDTFLIGMNDAGARSGRFARERAHILDILTALVGMRQPGSGYHAFNIDAAVLLTVANPATGAAHDGGVWQLATFTGGVLYPTEGSEQVRLSVCHTRDPASTFEWRMKSEFAEGICRLESSLETRRPVLPYLRYPAGRAELGRYRELLARIAEGWKPLVFVSLVTDEHGIEDPASLHPHAFTPDVAISAGELTRLQRECEKSATALDVAARWSEHWGGPNSPPIEFNFGGPFFDPEIDSDLVLYAYDALLAAVARNPDRQSKWCTEPLVMFNERSGVVFRYRWGALVFERTLVWGDAA